MFKNNMGSLSSHAVLPLAAPLEPTDVTAADFDGDGNVDLAASAFAPGADGPGGATDVVVLTLGDGQGGFGSFACSAVGGSEPVAILAQDLDGDGDMDLATANELSDDVSALYNEGTSALSLPSIVPVGLAPQNVVALGPGDLLTANLGSGDVTVTSVPAPPKAGLALFRSGGLLGSSVTYDLSGDPAEVYLLIPSLSSGPTPLSIVDPLDPRVLEVGLDLQAIWSIGLLDFSGQASETYPIPNSAGLRGLPLFAQALTFPGSPSVIDDLSNATGFALAAVGQSVNTVGDRTGAVDGHTATLLDDGRVVLAGGVEQLSPATAVTLDRFELFDPQTQTFALAGGLMQHPRSSHAAVKLKDGRLLLLGGLDDNGDVVATGDVWDPVTEVAAPIAPMSSPRILFSATVLGDGRVFVAGGLSLLDELDQFGTLNSALMTTETYDPAANSWQAGPSLPTKLVGHNASLLGNGQALITGGTEVTTLFGLPLPTITTACRRFNPATGSFLATAPLPGPRSDHAQVTLPDGRALVAGGQTIAGIALLILNTTARYDVATNTWQPGGSLNVQRILPQLVVAQSSLVVLGGISQLDTVTGAATPETSIEVAPLSAASWTVQGAFLLPRPGAVSVPVDGGERVLTTGVGDNASMVPDRTAEVYAP